MTSSLNDKMLQMNKHIENHRFEKFQLEFTKPSESMASKRRHRFNVKNRLKQLEIYYPAELEQIRQYKKKA